MECKCKRSQKFTTSSSRPPISTESSAMDSLPAEILEKILKMQLDADGRHLWRLRIVSTRWRNLVDYIIWTNP